MGFHGSPWREEPEINFSFFMWCVVGAVAGFLAGVMTGSRGKVRLLEDVLVGVFGAFTGGEIVASALAPGKAENVFSMSALGGAIGGAIVLLVLLKIMRGAVGPLRASKSPAARRR
jgi:uncharacterized membrane protein YeaQ/YmgE (transglycosylase-associated protein family)